MRIYLIGMPGCGKSTIGKLLAEKINYGFIDLDTEIEKDALMFIPDIFETYGEETFRNQETRILKEIVDENVVVSTGGGIVKKRENKKYMNGIVIWIDVEISELKQRLEDDFARPLLKTNSIEYLYDERRHMYEEFADFKVSNSNIKTCVDEISKIIFK